MKNGIAFTDDNDWLKVKDHYSEDDCLDIDIEPDGRCNVVLERMAVDQTQYLLGWKAKDATLKVNTQDVPFAFMQVTIYMGSESALVEVVLPIGYRLVKD